MSERDELYADSAQARMQDQRRHQKLDAWGNPIASASDFCFDYQAVADTEGQAKYRAGLKRRINETMGKMEKRLYAVNERA